MSATNRTNTLRAALKRGRLLRGTFQLTSDPAVTEVALGAGFDFVLVDAEHRALNPETIENLVRAAHGSGPGKSAVVRVPTIDRGAIQYPLDAGADGIVVPLVSSVEQAEEVAALTQYRPKGTRGLNAAARAAAWGQTDPAAYAAKVNRERVVAVQIETLAGLENVEAIAAVKGIDMLYVGPFDLSHSMGLAGQLDHKDVRAAITRICQAAQGRGKWLGILAPNVAFAQWAVQSGVRLLTYGSDLRLLKSASAQALAETSGLLPQ